jgi:DNA replicative helicase MCM subunit Mcm2 (Cdc46/Mcm family)
MNQFKGESDFPIYATKIRDMCLANQHLKEALPTIAMWVGLEPSLILPELNLLAYSIACKNFASYKSMFPEVFIKIKHLPIIDYIRDLRHIHLGKLIKSTAISI